jgi:hypothetical protein
MSRLSSLLIVIFLSFHPQPTAAEEFLLADGGVGPIPVSLKIIIRNEKEELTAFPRKIVEITATARNDSGQRIRYAKFCVQSERRTDGCDFPFSINEVWEPGETIVWMIDGASRRGIERARITLMKVKVEQRPK